MFDLSDYQFNETNPSATESYTGHFQLTNNRWLNYIIIFAERSAQWYSWKLIFFGAFAALLFVFNDGSTNAWKQADEMSDHAASDGWFRVFKDFKKNTSIKSTKINAHPIFKSEVIIDWEEETKLKFSRVYQYIKIKNSNGEFEDLLVMKKPAFNVDDETKTPEKLDDGNLIMTDAEDICDEFLGELPTNYQKSYFDRLRHWNIRAIEDELTQERGSHDAFFRCVIDQDRINDLIE